MSIREFLDALRSTQGQHTLASVLEGPESGARLLLCEGVPVWPARPEGLLARNLPALAGCGASGILTLENKRIFVEKFGGAPRLVICGGGHVAESVVRLAVMLGLPSPVSRSGRSTLTPFAVPEQKRSSAVLMPKISRRWRAVRRPTLLSPPAPTPSTWNALPKYTRNDLPTLVCWAAEAGRPLSAASSSRPELPRKRLSHSTPPSASPLRRRQRRKSHYPSSRRSLK